MAIRLRGQIHRSNVQLAMDSSSGKTGTYRFSTVLRAVLPLERGQAQR
jgi:hypothetical protein